MVTNVHEHGVHTCECPNCGLKKDVGESVKCRETSCPQCGVRMRAVETGEFRNPEIL